MIFVYFRSILVFHISIIQDNLTKVMHYHFFSSNTEQDYFGRILLFVKRNFWLYIPDFIALIIFVAPPYSWFETKIIIGIILILSIRDFLLLKFAIFHLGKLIIDEDYISLVILRKGEIFEQYSGKISEFDLKIKRKLFYKQIMVFKGDKLIHRQYAIGNWSSKKLQDLYDQFYKIKSELGLWKIFKGPMLN